MKLTAVIIDDEEDARQTLRSFLNMYCPEVTILAEAHGVSSGLEILKKNAPDIVLLDIRLEDGTGFDLLEACTVNFCVIFTTAYDQYAVKAFKFSAIDYLLKPIDPDELKRAIGKAKSDGRTNNARLGSLLHNTKYGSFDKITLSAAEGYLVLDIPDIVRVESSSNYSHLHRANGTKVTVAKSLKELEEMLPESLFVRIHQSHLVNMSKVAGFSHDNGGQLKLTNGTLLPVARRRKEELIAALSSFGRKN